MKRNAIIRITKNGEKRHLKNCIKKLYKKFHEPRTIGKTSRMKNSEALEGEEEEEEEGRIIFKLKMAIFNLT